jgi:ParB family transcriptional regulator, chromosome partitioning protein
MAKPKKPNIFETTVAKAQAAEENTVDALRRQIEELQSKGNESSLWLEPESIKLSPFQCRTYFDPQRLEELQNSINEYGVITPLIVRLIEGEYELIGGERRLRCAMMLNLKRVPVRILESVSDQQAAELVLVENLKREGINPIEEVRSILALIVSKNIPGCLNTQEAIAVLKKIRILASRGKEDTLTANEKIVMNDAKQIIEQTTANQWDSFLSNRLSLLDLPLPLQDKVIEGLDYTKAKLIAKNVKNTKEAQSIAQEAIEKGLSLSAIRASLKDTRSTLNFKDNKHEEQSNSCQLISAQLLGIQEYLTDSKMPFSKDEAEKLKILIASISSLIVGE